MFAETSFLRDYGAAGGQPCLRRVRGVPDLELVGVPAVEHDGP